MSTVLKTRIVKIGNSHGVRIPKVWLEQLDLGEQVEMAVESDQIVIRAARHRRDNWDLQFREMAAQQEDQLLDQPAPTRWDQDEWQW